MTSGTNEHSAAHPSSADHSTSERSAASPNAAGVAAVVLNYNGTDETLACLEALATLQPGPGTIHVVDNGSEDDPVARIRAAFPAVRVSINPTNLGFGAGLNPLLEQLLEPESPQDPGSPQDRGSPQDPDSMPPEWIWLLNNDTRVHSDTLARLLEHAAGHPDAGAVGAHIRDLDPPHATQTLGGARIGRWRGNSRHFTAPIDDRQLDYITGAAMLLRSEALRDTGLFDPRFFLYWEDADLCIRLRARGWKLTACPDAVVDHRLSGTIGADKDELINASAVAFFRKHGPLGGWPAIIIGTGGRIARRLLRGDVEAARAVWHGAWNGLR